MTEKVHIGKTALIRGGMRQGTEHKHSKLTENDVREIRKLRAQKVSVKEVAKRFGVSEGSVSLIANRLSWTHVE